MKLEYVYENNNNIKNLLKIGSLLIAVIFILSSFWYSLEWRIRIIWKLILLLLVLCMTMFLYNLYMHKRYEKIKNQGQSMEGIVVDISSGIYGDHKKISAILNVEVDYKNYEIEDICNNKAVRKLKLKLNREFKTVAQNIIHDDKVSRFVPTQEMGGIPNDYEENKYHIDIYVLGDEIVADLDSLEID